MFLVGVAVGYEWRASPDPFRNSAFAADERCVQPNSLADENQEDTPTLPPVRLSEKPAVEAVREAIAALPVDFREVVVLRELEGLSYEEISEVSGVPLGTVMLRLAHARHRLDLLLSDRKQHDQL
jgi:RNA polymerase sigma factor (sigma-70 family)